MDVEIHATTKTQRWTVRRRKWREKIVFRLRVRSIDVYENIYYEYLRVDMIVACPDIIKSLQPP
jgi:hypothetical protein